MAKRSRAKIEPRHLQIADFTCVRCCDEATCDPDRICGLCRAIGQTAEPVSAKQEQKRSLFRLENLRRLFSTRQATK